MGAPLTLRAFRQTRIVEETLNFSGVEWENGQTNVFPPRVSSFQGLARELKHTVNLLTQMEQCLALFGPHGLTSLTQSPKTFGNSQKGY